MGLFDKLKKKDEQFIFIIDKPTFRQFILEEIEKAKEYDVPMAENITLFLSDGPKQIFITYDSEEDTFEVEYDGLDYQDMNGFFEHAIDPIPNDYIKIQLDWNDSTVLNDFKSAHPELKPEDF